ncbi:hypothetical protein ACHAWF_004114 [Thalassiosira exigua]
MGGAARAIPTTSPGQGGIKEDGRARSEDAPVPLMTMTMGTRNVPSREHSDDENQIPPEMPSSSGWTARVPSGDRRLVFSAIDNQLDAAKSAWREKHAAGEPNLAKEQLFASCIDRTGASLKEQFESLTVPIDVDEVERALSSFQARLVETRSPPPRGLDDSCDDESLSSDDGEDEDIEFDDDEILDRNAHDQAKQLRSRAREIAARVISFREEATGRALEMTRRDLAELLRVHGFAGCAEGLTSDEGERAAEDDDEKPAEVKKMQVALRTLASSLRGVDSGLAEKLESMKETIGTIESSVEKYQKLSQGDESLLSRTEKALFASEKPKDTARELGDDDASMNPDQKLARLLAGVL